MLATADEQSVAKVLAPAIAAQMRTRSSAGKLQQHKASGLAAASAANYAAVGMAARAAGTLVQAARDHLRRQVQELAALAADIQEDEDAEAAATSAAQHAQQGAVSTASGGVAGRPPVVPAGAADVWQQGQPRAGLQAPCPPAGSDAAPPLAPARDELSPDDLEHIQRQVANLGPAAAAATGQPGTPERLKPADVSIAPAAQRVWTQGVVR